MKQLGPIRFAVPGKLLSLDQGVTARRPMNHLTPLRGPSALVTAVCARRFRIICIPKMCALYHGLPVIEAPWTWDRDAAPVSFAGFQTRFQSRGSQSFAPRFGRGSGSARLVSAPRLCTGTSGKLWPGEGPVTRGWDIRCWMSKCVQIVIALRVLRTVHRFIMPRQEVCGQSWRLSLPLLVLLPGG